MIRVASAFSVLALLGMTLGCERNAPSPIQADATRGTVPAPAAPTAPLPAASPTPAAPPPADAKAPSAGNLTEIKKLIVESRQAFGSGETEKALAALNKVLELQPGQEEATLNKGRLLRRRGKKLEAIAVLDKGLEAQPKNWRFHYEKALSQYQAGLHREAIETLGVVVKFYESPSYARYLRVLAYASLGDKDGTITALSDAIENGYADIDRIDQEKLLDFLRGDERLARVRARLEELLGKKLKVVHSPWDAMEEPLPLPEGGRSYSIQTLLDALEGTDVQGEGDPIALEVKDLDGKPIKISDYAGKPLLVHIWGTWNRWNERELPIVERIRRTYEPKGLAVLGLCYELDAPPEAAIASARTFLSEQKLILRCAMIDKQTATKLAVDRYPAMLFISPRGALRLSCTGFLSGGELEALVETFLKPASALKGSPARPPGPPGVGAAPTPPPVPPPPPEKNR